MAEFPITALPAPSRPAHAAWPCALGVVAATLVAYAGSFPGIFAFDDHASILGNPTIRALWPPGPILQPPVEAGVGGRPLANLTFALNHAISGVQPWSYHAANLGLHLASALLLFGCIRRTLLRLPRAPENPSVPAMVAATLWAVHPLGTAVVNYASQRTEALMATCALLSLYAFIRALESPSRRWSFLSVAACLLGAGAKETIVVVPVLLFWYDRAFGAGSWRAAWTARRGLYGALALTWVAVAALAATSHLAARGVGTGLGVSPFVYALTQGPAWLHYFTQAFWPSALAFDHGWAFASGWRDAAPALIVVGTAALGVAWLVRRRPDRGFLAAWVGLFLVPTSSVIPIVQQPIAENRMYLPLAGVLVAVVFAARGLLRGHRALGLGLAAGIVAAAGATIAQRHRAYASEVTLWTDTVAQRPGNARAHGNLAAALLRENHDEQALAAARRAVALRPGYPEGRTNLGLALRRAGRTEEAIAEFRAALAVRPDLVDARYNLGEALASDRRSAEAIDAFQAVLRVAPAHAAAHNNLGVLELAAGRLDEALAHDRAAVRLDPALAEAHFNLGNALARHGETTAALASYAEALRLRPAFPRAHNNLGAALLRTGRREEAIAHFEAAVLLDPDYAEARRNLAIVRGP